MRSIRANLCVSACVSLCACVSLSVLLSMVVAERRVMFVDTGGEDGLCPAAALEVGGGPA